MPFRVVELVMDQKGKVVERKADDQTYPTRDVAEQRIEKEIGTSQQQGRNVAGDFYWSIGEDGTQRRYFVESVA